MSKQSDMPALDLSFLSESEIAHIREVLNQSKETEVSGPDKKFISSDDVIGAQRKSDHESFISSRDIVDTALSDLRQPDIIIEEVTINDVANIDEDDTDKASTPEESTDVPVINIVEVNPNESEDPVANDETLENESVENSPEEEKEGENEEEKVEGEGDHEHTDLLDVVAAKKSKKAWWKKLTPKRKQGKQKDFDSKSLDPIDETLVVYKDDKAAEDNTDVDALAAADAKSQPRVKLTMKAWVKTKTWPKTKSSTTEATDVMAENDIPNDNKNSDKEIIAIQPTVVNGAVTDAATPADNEDNTELKPDGQSQIEEQKDIQTEPVCIDNDQVQDEQVEQVEFIHGGSANQEVDLNSPNEEIAEETQQTPVVTPVIVKLKTEDEILMEMEERDSLAPLPGTQSDNDVTDDEEIEDTASVISRSTTMSEDGVVGIITIAVIYYEPSAKKNTKCPPKGTKLNKQDKFDVLSRRNYVDLTKARLPVLRGSFSGALPKDDGELHVLVREAVDLKLPSAVLRNKSKTYVKCYLLPDKNHASKMHSMTCRETNSPQFGHIFVFRGFNEEEFQKRCVEISICGQTKRRGRSIRIGGVRLLANDQVLEYNLSDNSKGIDVWNKVFKQPGQEVEATLPLVSSL